MQMGERGGWGGDHREVYFILLKNYKTIGFAMSGLKFSYFKIIGIIERGGKCVLVVKSQKRNLKNTSPNNEKHFMNDRNSLV